MIKNKNFKIAVLLSLLFAGFIAGCKNNSDDASTTNNNNTPPSGASFQSQIDATANGGSVTLDTSLSGSTINVNRGMSINGNGVQNLSIVVNSSVANDVTLSNFTNATITIQDDSSDRISLSRSFDRGNTASNSVKPKEIGQNNPKITFEGCTINKLTAKKNISIHMKPNTSSDETKKTSIKNLEITKDASNIAIIEEEEDNLENAKKSTIEKLKIENGVDEVNLVGGRFDDVEFSGEFTEKVDLYYDKKGDQVKQEFEAKLLQEQEKVASKDVCSVKNGNEKYKFTLPGEKLSYLNGAFFIILLTDDQKQAFLQTPHTTLDWAWTWATVEHPYYAISYTGKYKCITNDTNVHNISGDSTEYYLWDGTSDNKEYYEFYKNYTKEAICSQKVGNNLEIYLDLANLQKSDIAACAYKSDGQTDEYYLTPKKLTEIDLTGYKPYIVVDPQAYLTNKYQQEGAIYQESDFEEVKALFNVINNSTVYLPISKSNGNFMGQSNVYAIAMENSTTYPDVSNVTYNQWSCAQMLTIYTFDAAGVKDSGRRMPVKQFRFEEATEESNFDFFMDESCAHLFWNYDTQITSTVTTIYKKTGEKIKCYNYFNDNNLYEVSRMAVWLHKEMSNYGLYTTQTPSQQTLVQSIDDLVPGNTYYMLNQQI